LPAEDAYAGEPMTVPGATKHQRKYVQVAFHVPAESADDAAGLLVSHGALGCAVAGDNRRVRNGESVRLEAWFARLRAAQLASIRSALAACGMLANGRAPARRSIADPGWATAWKVRFRPLAIGRMLIVPPWNAHTATRRLKIVLNPGQAFGTGHHPTTRGALRAVDSLCASRRFQDALDVGTGSGVLAIAMRLMGVKRIAAIDIDEQALENARENAALNSMQRRIRFSSTPVARFTRRFDLITANILSSTLIGMARTLVRLLARDGRLVLGGILNREAPAVLAEYSPRLRCMEMRRDRGWTTLVMAR
jgi:ribosomal protein L11 methyltransferase